ncbi:uncharacterized protein At2g33490 [Ricinus communis]|uniref:uncharacterized protein At2g33490 n=1 Tax=Ricinus communis TaxID=3988 RepID=UPI0007729323|nr:uncharacterized protein At2g33490 [Ricinus communis]|eukprot:XP_002512882.2 uncharacterized protein At2g33490 [Ricinus communis]
MKSPLGKLRGFKLHKSDTKDKRDLLPSAQLDELAQAAEDMQDMRNCYDSLLSAAAATANSAYEFSESLQEMGSCLLEKTALHDDEQSGRVLLMLGKVQFELQKLVDSYRSHIFLTITNPSESLLNELRTVEDMKRQCDEKRNVYEYMVAQQKEKGKSKSGKGESFTLQELRTAHDEYDEEATLCVFRLKSLKQGQSRSLLTQAARHHAAQLNFFRKGLKSLEAVDDHVKIVAEQQHIDYQFSGLEDDGREDGEDDDDIGDANEGRELSFDYRENKQGHDVISASRNSMEVDDEDLSFPQASFTENAELNPDKSQGGLQASLREPRPGSHSAPIFPERKSDPIERIRLMQSSARKSNTYVLPTPIDAKSPISSRTSGSVANTRPSDFSGRTHNLWHSSPLEQKKHEKDPGDYHLSELTALKTRSAHKDSSINSTSTLLPPPLVEGISLPHLDMYNASDNKKIKRQSFSGPITSKPWSTKPALSASGPIFSNELPQQVSGVPSRVTIPQNTSPKVSPTASPPLASSPRISELHELPRPPGNFVTKPAKSSAPVGHSAPLVRNPEHSGTIRVSSGVTNLASPLPIPPLIVPRSFSIPSSSQRAMTIHVSKSVESLQMPDKTEEVDSPPLTPISLANLKTASTISEIIPHSGQIRGGS